MKCLYASLLLLSVLLGAGCLSSDVHQAYPGAALAANETCTLQVPGELEVRAIDGIPTDWSLRIRKDPVQTLSLVAGGHRLQVKYYDPTADESKHEIYDAGPFDLSFVGSAGSVHALRFETVKTNPELRKTNQKVLVWVDRIKAGQVAAAVQPVAPVVPLGTPAAAPTAGADEMQSQWRRMSPAERENFRKWVQTQP